MSATVPPTILSPPTASPHTLDSSELSPLTQEIKELFF